VKWADLALIHVAIGEDAAAQPLQPGITFAVRQAQGTTSVARFQIANRQLRLQQSAAILNIKNFTG